MSQTEMAAWCEWLRLQRENAELRSVNRRLKWLLAVAMVAGTVTWLAGVL
jgi:hypothetical protein